MRILNDGEIGALPKTMFHGITVSPNVVKRAQHQLDLRDFVEWLEEHLHESPACSYKYCFSDKTLQSLKQLAEE